MTFTPIDGPLDLSSYFSLASLQGFQKLKDDPWPSQQSPDFLAGTNLFEIIAESDRLLVHLTKVTTPSLNLLMRPQRTPK